MIKFKQYNILLETKNNIVTFDFDWTLCSVRGNPNSIGIERLNKHLDDGDTVAILTSRNENEQNIKDILKFLKTNVPKSESLEQTIFFTNRKDKADFIKKLKDIKIIKHYDDDPHEIETINKETNTEGELMEISNKLKEEWKDEYGVDWDYEEPKNEYDYNGLRWDAGDFCESDELPILLLTVGIPGSGKSTWIKKHSKGFEIVSPDEIRKRLTGDISDQSQNGLVFKIARDNITKRLNDGKNVIFDATNVDTATRKKFVKELPKAQLQAKLFDIEPKEAKARIKKRKEGSEVPDDIVDTMHKQYLHTKDVIEKEGYKLVGEQSKFNQPHQRLDPKAQLGYGAF